MSEYFAGESVLVVGSGAVAEAIERAIGAEGGAATRVDEFESTSWSGALTGLVIVAGPTATGMTAATDALLAAERAVTGARDSLVASSRGAIVIVVPGAGAEAALGLVGYAATTAGLAAATRAWAVDLGAEGIRANVVRPGVLSTDLALTSRTPGHDIGYIPLVRAGSSRLGTSADVGALVAFLLSEDARYITGADVHVDGAMSQSRNSSAFALWDARESD